MSQTSITILTMILWLYWCRFRWQSDRITELEKKVRLLEIYNERKKLDHDTNA